MAEVANGNNLDKNKNGKVHLKHSRFPIKQELKHTYPFGLIGVNMRFNGIAADRVRTRNVADVRSYTIGTPLMDSIFMNKTFVQVPRMAILPKNWEKLYRQPAIGEDIDQETYGTSVKKEIFNNFVNQITTNIYTNGIRIQQSGANLVVIHDYIRNLILAESIFSKGCLLNQMGCKLWKLFKKGVGIEIDQLIENFVNNNTIGSMLVSLHNETRRVIFPNDEYNPEGREAEFKITVNEFLFEVRDGNDFTIQRLLDQDGNEIPATSFNEPGYDFTHNTREEINYKKPIDIARLWAYQLTCAEYFTNDKVDHIYSAELYRQYIASLEYEADEDGQGIVTFTLNGVKYEADYLSAAYFEKMTNYWNDYNNEASWAYMIGLFKFNRSLKFKDYFTGARTRPLAIGDTSIPVQSGETVDVVDVTKNIQWQRFLNVVEKIPQNLAGYTRGIMGTGVQPDFHNPLFLGTTTEQIYGQETENTGEAQQTQENSVTTNLRNGSAKYEFGFNLDRDSIVIGLVWFDIERNYTMGVERNFMHVDRLDRFNPYMQYTGDQPVYAQEVDASMQNENFGYQGSYMEFKQEYAEASGGFATKALAGWSFTDFYSNTEERVNDHQNITPDYIRSKPTELDNFFVSLSGHSLGNYFHFIVRNVNYINANRPMSVNPGILG